MKSELLVVGLGGSLSKQRMTGTLVLIFFIRAANCVPVVPLSMWSKWLMLTFDPGDFSPAKECRCVHRQG